MEKVQKILLIASLISILFLMILTKVLTPEITALGDINSKYIGKQVQVTGNIIQIKSYNNNTFYVIKIGDKTGNITSVFNSDKNLSFNKNITCTIRGKIQKYNNTLQIQADLIYENL